MRILFIHGNTDDPGKAGGAESLLRDQAAGLKELGHECSWYYGAGSLENAIKQFQPDICHLMTIHCYPMGMYPAVYLQEHHIPHVWHIQDYWPFCATRMMMIGDKSCSGVAGVCRNECGYHANPDYLRICNQSPIIAGNANTAEIYRRNGLRCDYVVELGVDVNQFYPEEKDNPPTIWASASQLAGSWKGMHILQRALENTPYKFNLITGAPRQVVADKLHSASIFVFPSCYEETFGLSLCEAMASGCAVITSNNAGGLAQVKDGVTGFVVHKGDSQKLGRVIELLIDYPSFRHELGENARAHVVQDHSLEAMAKRFERVYIDAIARNK